MEGFIDNAKKFLGDDQGKDIAAQIKDKTGYDINNVIGQQGQSTDAYGNRGQPGQFGQEGQYGAVTGKGFGGGLAKPGPNAMGGNQESGVREGKSAYEGYQDDDSTTSGGYGKNAGGNAFSRSNQMGADNSGEGNFDDDEAGHGYKTGTSTPGYRQEGDVDIIASENAMRNANMNVYGQQADDRGATGNDYNEAI